MRFRVASLLAPGLVGRAGMVGLEMRDGQAGEELGEGASHDWDVDLADMCRFDQTSPPKAR